MLVSILIPCHNAERWIAQAIQSALDQTWPQKEIIVVDDGSSDNSLQVIQTFDHRIRWESQQNRGANVARNRLLELSTGQWLQYLDADNYLRPEKLGRQISFAASQPTPPDAVYSPTYIAHDNDSPHRSLVIESDDAFLNFIRWSPFDTTSLLFRRSVVIEAGTWKEDQPCCQEHELILRMLRLGCSFGLLNEPLAVYREHRNERVSKRNPMLTARVRMHLTDQIESLLEQNGEMTADHRRALAIARLEVARLAYQHDFIYARDVYRAAQRHCGGWLPSSKACPLAYRLAALLLGFQGAEAVASWRRWVMSSARNPFR